MLPLHFIILLLLQSTHHAAAFQPLLLVQPRSTTCLSASTSSTTGSYAPRTGLAQSLLNLALDSPLWTYVLVPQARQKMVSTAQANGIEWNTAKESISQQVGEQQPLQLPSTIPDYYQSASFHAYAQGNLCWDAALEQEIASRAVGARNFPQYGQEGDVAFRQSFLQALLNGGAKLPSNQDKIAAVDMGCGTGLSSRQLACTEFDNGRYIDKVIGLDLSPYYIHVGQTLLSLAPLDGMPQSKATTTHAWINPIDARAKEIVELRVANIEDTGLQSNSVDIVQILFVLHELPAATAAKVIEEAHRIVKPGGQVWIGEMDFQAPAYAAQRANPLLFSLIRATEPYLDAYADGFVTHVKGTVERLFDTVVWKAATGRHYACVATKGKTESDNKKASVQDDRFLPNGDYAMEDTHLQLWESKQD